MTTPLLTFRRSSPAMAREVARLGEIIVGEIIPLPPGVRPAVSWRVSLPRHPVQGGGAASFEVGRRRIQDEMSEWLQRAGLLDPGTEVRVSVEAPS
ncbi:hypothetical protein RA307_09910 [Xanthobacteraceae bacterium Astr-EGSB]|uniref:hypothetical protein n=1 Tax=Astrobacterium formosum TaxID=3069710 RepID=UPI0027ADE71D|nr:hypothetical protein [Xanthobacteraceae bacterium Astr-EGSB]